MGKGKGLDPATIGRSSMDLHGDQVGGRLARSMGAHAEKATDTADLEARIVVARGRDIPSVIVIDTDPAEVAAKYIDRVSHIHAKNVRPDIMREVRDRNLSFLEGVRRGAFSMARAAGLDTRDARQETA